MTTAAVGRRPVGDTRARPPVASATRARRRSHNRRMTDPGDQLALFADSSKPASSGLPAGWEYRTDFISVEEEAALLAAIAELPLEEARYRGYVA